MRLASILTAAGGAALAAAVARDGVPAPEEYGFSGLINSRLNDGCALLQAADVDSDGDLDLVVVNNARARIDFLLQRKPGEELGDDEATRLDERLTNDIVDEVHFRRDSFPTEQKVSSFAIADLNGDSRNDLAYTGDSGKLWVALRTAKGTFGDKLRFDLDEPSQVSQAVRCADVDGDGRNDVLALGKKKTFVFRQDESGRLTAATELLNATTSPDGFSLADLDGDGKLDLLYVKLEADAPLRFRLNRGGGHFGPERMFPFAELRDCTVADADGDGRVDVAAILRRSGRLAVLRYTGAATAAKPGELLLSSPRVVAHAAQKDEKPRDELLADLDGDGKPELIVAEPSAARVVVHRADPDGLGSVGESFPSLVGARHPRLADVDGDGKAELLVTASDEGAIGVARIDAQGRLSLPEPLGYKADQVLAIDVGDSDSSGTPDEDASGKPAVFAVLVTGKSVNKTYDLARVASGAADAETLSLGKLPVDPNDLWLIDVDRDGLKDAIVFLPTETPRVLLAKSADGKSTFEELKASDVPGLGVLKGVAKAALHFGDVDGDGTSELLVPGPNFARAFVLGKKDGKAALTVVGQWNLEDAGAKVGAVAAADLDGDQKPEILVTEKTTKTLRVLRTVDGEVRTLARVDLGDLEPKGLRVADLDGDGRDDVVLLGEQRFAVVQSGRSDPGFAEAIDFETPLKGAYLDEVQFGDVNSDGVMDAVMTETNQHRLAIAACKDGKLTHVLQFPIFEESIFERDGGGGREPRELVLADLTGDQKTDVALLVHDRILVYPQE